MEIVATQKFVRMSPLKVRLVTRAIVRLTPEQALDVLPEVHKAAAPVVAKVIKTALANARDRKVTGELKFKEIQVGEGPRYKRYRFVARGRVHPELKRTSHIRVVLETVKEQPATKKTKPEVKATAKVQTQTKVKASKKTKKIERKKK